MVHHHFMLVPNLTVVENVALGLLGKRIFKLNLSEARNKILEVSKLYGLSVHPDAYIWQLSVGEQQRVELIKVLCLGANLLILDEPTDGFSQQQVSYRFVLVVQEVFVTCRPNGMVIGRASLLASRTAVDIVRLSRSFALT